LHLGGLRESLAHQNRGRLILFAPVFFGAGCAFSVEAGRAVTLSMSLVVALVALAVTFGFQHVANRTGRQSFARLSLLGWGATLLCIGASFCLWHTARIATPVVSDIDSPVLVTGWVEGIETGANGPRVRLQVFSYADRLATTEKPATIRFALRNQDPPRVGSALRCRVIMRAPAGPVVPNAFDFARHAWFTRLGGVGFALGVCAPAELPKVQTTADQLTLGFAQLRADATNAIIGRVPGPGGGFLAAMTTGDRSALPPEDHEALRVSGLYHLLSVSGLHIGIVAGATFFVLRWMLALIGPLALRCSIRKVAALAALSIAGFYTVFSGGDPPAVRSWIMSAIALGAIVLDRPAISMRGLAVAAFICLLISPNAVVEPGFQMSFAATGGLVALFEAWQRRDPDGPPPSIFMRCRDWAAGIAATSLVAGTATAPFAAYHFSRATSFGLISNLVSEPFILFVVAPASLTAAMLAPFGLSDVPLAIAAWGLDQVLAIARVVAQWPYASTIVPPVPPWTLGASAIGLIWIVLWRTWFRWLGTLAFMAAGIGMVVAPKTELWISPESGAVLYTPWRANTPGKPHVCISSGARFDASRLTDAAGLADKDQERLEPAPRARLKSPCRIELLDGGRLELVWGKLQERSVVITTPNAAPMTISKGVNGVRLRRIAGQWQIEHHPQPKGLWQP